MTMTWQARFFAGAGVHPPSALMILALTVGVGVWTTSVSPGDLDSGLGMLLFVQMFLASSGFLVRARRGHFDPLLGGAGDRTSAVVWHWIVSIGPGVVAWILIAGSGYFFGSPMAISALVGRRAAAFFIVSALAWTAGFALPRGAGGVVWAAALLGLLLSRVDLLSSPAPLPSSFDTVLRHGVALALCPFLLIGDHALVASGAICTAALLAVIPLLAVWRHSNRLDLYLMDHA